MNFNIEPKDLNLQDAAGMQLVEVIRKLASESGAGDYEDLENLPKINGVTLVGNKTSEDLEIAITDEQVAAATDSWLADNVAQETGYVLDSTLTMSNAAAPADKVGELKTELSYAEDSINNDLVLYAPNGDYAFSTYLTVKQENNKLTLNGKSNATSTQSSTKILLSDHLAAWNATSVPSAEQVYTLKLLKGHKYKIKAEVISGTRDKTTGAGTLMFRLYTSAEQVFTMTLAIADTEVSDYYISDGSPVAVRMHWARLLEATNLVINLTIQDVTSESNSIIYVASNGSDNNSGLTATDPKATVDAALKAGADTVVLLGGVYQQTIDLNKCTKGSLSIKPYEKDKIVYFYGVNSLVTDSASAVSGYTKVKSAPCTKTFNQFRVLLFQDNVADEATAISGDRFAVQNGRATRCNDTKITICNSDNLADALTEIENATDYRWFMDTENSVLYFSCPETVSSTNPIRGGFDTSGVLLNGYKGLSLEVSGLYVKYQPIDVSSLTNVTFSDCHVANACANGDYIFDSVENVAFIRCEAERCYKGDLGDGFNAHSDKTGDTFAPQTTFLLIDCWAHDNMDDGVSTHERSVGTVIGGLFEYNTLGSGVTPANGAHITCHDSVCQCNDNGYEITGNPDNDEGGVGTQLDCFGCVSKNNNTSGFNIGASQGYAHLVNCVAVSEAIGFKVETGATAEAINCTTADCTSAKSGTITIKTGTPLS